LIKISLARHIGHVAMDLCIKRGRMVVIVYRLFVCFCLQVVAMLSGIVHDAFDEVLEVL